MKWTPMSITIAALAGAGVLYFLKKKADGLTVAGVAASAAGAAIDAANGAIYGTVTTIGTGFGLPLTDQTKCEQARANGDTWGASLYCTAPQFGGYALGGLMDTAKGAVISIGEAIGIPATNQSKCEQAKAAGNKWDASFACSAGDFLGYVWDGMTGSDTQAAVSAYENTAQRATGAGGASGSW